jgi:putative transposase
MAKTSIFQDGGVYFVTLKIVGWTDIFIRSEYREEIVNNLNFCIRNKGLKIYSFCLMTNHLHMIASCEEGLLNKILRDFKSFTAKKIIQMIEDNPKESRKEWILNRLSFLAQVRSNDSRMQFWERDNYPERISTDYFYRQKENYIHENPLRAGFVLRPEDWAYSSACPECPLLIERGETTSKKAAG